MTWIFAAGTPKRCSRIRPNGRDLHALYPPTQKVRFFKAVWSPDGREMLAGCYETRTVLDRICTISARGKDACR